MGCDVPKQLGAGQPQDQPRVHVWEWGWLQAGGRGVTVSHVWSRAAGERKGQREPSDNTALPSHAWCCLPITGMTRIREADRREAGGV